MRPHVSLIIPVHNAEPFLTRCLDSAAAQTEPELEIICVDDASTDASGAMLEERARHDRRFRVAHRAVNGGESAARNQGVALARGEYLAFLDHDDMLEPDACRLLYRAARDVDADIAKGRVKTIGYDGKGTLSSLQLQKDICDISKFYFNGDWWSAIYHARLVRGSLIFAEEYPLGGDILFLTQALMAATRITCVDDLVYTHFLHSNNGDSPLLSLEKIRSTFDVRLRIIELLHEMNLNVVDKSGYLYRMWQSFALGIDMLYNRCLDGESRKLCCDYLFAVKNMHRCPIEFFESLEKSMEDIFPLFVGNCKKILRNLVEVHDDLHSPEFSSALLIAKLRCGVMQSLGNCRNSKKYAE